eukprot:CAMPEP_0172189864 /NCGR_PEP_ID=MMETSP1050-20130122/22774_1 /TAXON_ID=233186 /ORGANISM="Cryptomonas curvata, Strain CCAP979/52" /LENGTH=231 /DNA_ID=CAMNT_0012864633 /DNA_START=20 /DNA_END=711 /DNA_ORIENTATION=+
MPKKCESKSASLESYDIGEVVYVKWEDEKYRAKIAENLGHGKYRIMWAAPYESSQVDLIQHYENLSRLKLRKKTNWYHPKSYRISKTTGKATGKSKVQSRDSSVEPSNSSMLATHVRPETTEIHPIRQPINNVQYVGAQDKKIIRSSRTRTPRKLLSPSSFSTRSYDRLPDKDPLTPRAANPPQHCPEATPPPSCPSSPPTSHEDVAPHRTREKPACRRRSVSLQHPPPRA